VESTAAGGEGNNSDGDSSSADDGRPQYFIRNSDSSATSGDDSSNDTYTTAASTAAAQEQSRPETAHRGRAMWCSRAKTVAKRKTRKLNGECSVVEGPSRVRLECPQDDKSQGPLRRDFRDSKPDPAANIGTVG
jgi:hypothetical protein